MKTYPLFMNLLTNMARDDAVRGGKNTYSSFREGLVGSKCEAGTDEIEKNMNYSNVFGSLETAKYFVVDEHITKMLELTNTPKDVDPNLIRLPYPNIYIDADLGDIKGILVSETVVSVDDNRLNQICKLLHGVGHDVTKKELIHALGEKTRAFYIHYLWVEKDKQGNVARYWIRHTGLFVDSEIDYMKTIIRDIKLTKITKKVRDFVYNFLLFLNQPEVELKEVVRSDKNREKALKKGKMPLPTTHEVLVTGKLKIYIDKLKSGGHFSYSHRFWVRGHFRTLRDQKRYGEKAGTTLWIEPYIKGKGMLIDRGYNVHRVEKEGE